MTDEEVFGSAAPAPDQGLLQRAKDVVGWPKPLPEGAPIPTLQERLAQDRGGEDPNSWGNLADRAFTNVVTAIPDTGIGLMNIGARAAGNEQIPYLSQMMRANAGAKEMPADASIVQRSLEGLLAAAAGGGPRGLIPGALGVAGAEGGAALGQATGVDPETLAILGGGLASQGRPVATNVGRGTIAALYGGAGKPNAAELMNAADRTGVRPTGATLGGPTVQRLEQTLERRPGTGPGIMAEKARMRGELGAAADAVPAAAGATMTTPTEIGRATQETAGAALTALEDTNRLRQQQLQNQMQGGNAPINVADLDRTMSQIVGAHPSQSNLSPNLANPVANRLDELRQMYRPVPEGQQGPPVPEVRQAPFVSWRNDLLNKREGEPPIAQNASIPITQEARGAYRDAAIREGVPPGQFDVTQMRSRNLPGQREVLEPLSDRAQTDYETAYNRGPAAWDTNPQGQQDFRSAVNAAQGVTAGEPTVNNILASRFNDLLANTLHWRQDSATGPIKFADTMRDKMDPATVSGAVGPQGAQTLYDVAELARAAHRPTVQGGASQSLRDVVGGVMNRLVLPAVTAGASHLAGAGPGTSGTLATLAAGAHQAFGSPIDHLRALMLRSDPALNAMAGRPTNYAPPSMANLVSSLQAIQGSTPRGLPQPPMPPPAVAPPVSR